jgi:hypothetical protein
MLMVELGLREKGGAAGFFDGGPDVIVAVVLPGLMDSVDSVELDVDDLGFPLSRDSIPQVMRDPESLNNKRRRAKISLC